MVRRCRNYSVLLVAILFLFLMPLSTYAADAKQRIFDDGNILTKKEISHLEKVAEKYSNKRKTDFIVLTIDDSEKDVVKYMGDFYDEHGLGYAEEKGNAAIITINMATRDVTLNGFGIVEKKLPDDRLTTIRKKVTPALSDENYEEAFEDFIKLSAKYMQFKEGANPANPLYNPWIQIALAFVIGIAIVYMLARNPGMKKTVNANTYFDNNQSRVNQKSDRYIRTSVTKKPKPKKNKSSGGGSGGGGGVTGGGSSFSGSRGKF